MGKPKRDTAPRRIAIRRIMAVATGLLTDNFDKFI